MNLHSLVLLRIIGIIPVETLQLSVLGFTQPVYMVMWHLVAYNFPLLWSDVAYLIAVAWMKS